MFSIICYNGVMATKDKVLEILKDNLANGGQAVSGEHLAEVCSVSRAAVWKAVNTLRDQGYNIQGTTNGGYVLNEDSDLFSQELFVADFNKQFPALAGNHTECFKTIDSTNTYAKRILSEAGNLRDAAGELTTAGKLYHNSVYVAESQTAGRGRLGRTFYSPSKTGVYLSVIYAPKGGIVQPAKLTAFSAVAVCRAIKKLYGLTTDIKWINDIYYNGKKLSGILTEGITNFETGQIEAAIVGIGINVADNPEVFPAEVAKIAGSITGSGSCGQSFVSRCQLAAQVAGEVLSIFGEESSAVMNEYKTASFLIGQTIQVHPVIGDDKSVYEAKAVDIDENAGLVVELEDGSRKTLSSGEVSLHPVN